MLDVKVNSFLKVCEYLNITRAAEALNLTQPAVSKHLHALEEYYGVKLFSYKNKKLSLTVQGQYLHKAMIALQRDERHIRESIQTVGQKEKLYIGATESIGGYYLPPLIIRFIKQHPELAVSVIIGDTKELLQKLDRGEIAFLLCEGNFHKQDYEYRLLKKSVLTVLCGRDYNTDNIEDLGDLFAHRMLVRESGSGTRDVFERFLEASGYTLQNFRDICVVNNPEMILRLLEADLGVSVLYRDVGEKLLQTGKLKEITIATKMPEHEFNAVWSKDSQNGAYYARLIEEFREK